MKNPFQKNKIAKNKERRKNNFKIETSFVYLSNIQQ